MIIVTASEVFQGPWNGHSISEISMRFLVTGQMDKQVFVKSIHFPRFDSFYPCTVHFLLVAALLNNPGSSQRLT
jgi:hypothetical protein